jgi:hypothetical protein
MPTFEYDLGYLQAGLQELEAYLLSNDVYWPSGASAPPGEPEYPQITLGGLMLAHNRMLARATSVPHQTRLADVTTKFEKVRAQWRVAWGHKAGREFHSRLNLWRDFLEDVRTNPEEHIDRYNYEVGRRTMLEMLKNESSSIPRAELDLLDVLDKLLRAIFKSGPFVWEPELQAVFPAEVHWYLYGRLKGSKH